MSNDTDTASKLAELKKPLVEYKGNIDMGTEEMTSEDINTPILKVIQSNTQGIKDKKEGRFFRSDTGEMFDSVEVSLVYVTTMQVENYNKTAVETVKLYYGFYSGTNEPFKMFVRGWSMEGHRNFQTELSLIKRKYQVPMLGLHVVLTTEPQSGTIQETGKPYSVHKLKFGVRRSEDGTPVIEDNKERIAFLMESYIRFKAIKSNPTERDQAQNDPIASGNIPF